MVFARFQGKEEKGLVLWLSVQVKRHLAVEGKRTLEVELVFAPIAPAAVVPFVISTPGYIHGMIGPGQVVEVHVHTRVVSGDNPQIVVPIPVHVVDRGAVHVSKSKWPKRETGQVVTHVVNAEEPTLSRDGVLQVVIREDLHEAVVVNVRQREGTIGTATAAVDVGKSGFDRTCLRPGPKAVAGDAENPGLAEEDLLEAVPFQVHYRGGAVGTRIHELRKVWKGCSIMVIYVAPGFVAMGAHHDFQIVVVVQVGKGGL